MFRPQRHLGPKRIRRVGAVPHASPANAVSVSGQLIELPSPMTLGSPSASCVQNIGRTLTSNQSMSSDYLTNSSFVRWV